MLPSCPRQRHAAGIALALTLVMTFSGSVNAQDRARELSSSFRDAAKRVLPGVVTIRPQNVGVPAASGALGMLMPRTIEPSSPGGSGVVIDAARGLILTNDHVIQNASTIAVVLSDGRERTVTQVRRDPRSDLALLAIKPDGLQQADWGDSEALELGDWVLAIGQPFGLSGTVTAGIVSGKGRGIDQAVYEDLIQTDAAINPGNSGGPLVNLQGEIVGINSAINTVGGGYEGVGFAVPSNRARRVAHDLANYGLVRRSTIGIRIGLLDPRNAERIGQPGAVLVTEVSPLSPAAEGGLKTGDVILAIGDRTVRGIGMLQSIIEVAPAGEPLALEVLRGGQRLPLQVRPTTRRDTAPRPENVPTRPEENLRSTPTAAPESVADRVADSPALPLPRNRLPPSLTPLPLLRFRKRNWARCPRPPVRSDSPTWA